ncbi:MAG: glycosyltransferase family 4 protein [Anaerolineae bacterium]|nr:glycosyltransferase family 4 protein [Anaerolineae bacterium]
MPHLVIPLSGLNASGGVRVVTHLANTLVQQGWQVSLIVPDYQASPAFALDDRVLRRVLRVPGRGRLRWLVYHARLAWLACQGADVCLATYYLTPLPIYLSWWRHGRRARLVYFVQGYELESHVALNVRKRGMEKYLTSMLIRLSYGLPFLKVANSQWTRNKLGQANVQVIPIGLDEARFASAEPIQKPNNLLIIGGVGRRGPTKGFEVLVETLSAFIGRPGVEVRILSDLDLTLPEGIRHIKPASDGEVAEFYRACTVFVFTSVMEGFGLPPLEAMACGAAVVTTDCGGVRDYATPLNALIVPVNDVAALRAGVERLLEDEALRARLVAAGYQVAEQFTATATSQRFMALLNELVNTH